MNTYLIEYNRNFCLHFLLTKTYVDKNVYYVQSYIYIYIYISGESSLFLLLVPPPTHTLCQLQFPTRGPWTQSKSSQLLLRDSPLYSTD